MIAEFIGAVIVVMLIRGVKDLIAWRKTK